MSHAKKYAMLCLTVHGQINRHWENIYRVRIHEDGLPGDQ